MCIVLVSSIKIWYLSFWFLRSEKRRDPLIEVQILYVTDEEVWCRLSRSMSLVLVSVTSLLWNTFHTYPSQRHGEPTLATYIQSRNRESILQSQSRSNRNHGARWWKHTVRPSLRISPPGALRSTTNNKTTKSKDTNPSAQSQLLLQRIKDNSEVCSLHSPPPWETSARWLTDWMVCCQTATQKSTISPLKILSKDEENNNNKEQRDNGEQAAKDPTLTGPQTAGMTSGVSGEVDKGIIPRSFPLWRIR